MKFSNKDVRLQDINLAKDILKSELVFFTLTELVTDLTTEQDVYLICDKYSITLSKYCRRVLLFAVKDITNCKNLPYPEF